MACCLAAFACRSAPDQVSVALSESASVLGRATLEASSLSDPVQQVDVLTTIAEGFLLSGRQPDALAVALEALRVTGRLPVSPEIVQLRLDLAATLLLLEETATARGVISDATVYSRLVRDEQERAHLLIRIVEAAVTGTDDTRDLLQTVVNEVYVIESPDLRASTLIDVAEAYQRVGVGQPVTGLIHQAIPAIRSLPDPARRAFLFARLSFRALEAGEAGLASGLVEDATDESFASGADINAETARTVAAAVVRSEGLQSALGFVQAIAGPHPRAAGYLAVAEAIPDARTSVTLLEHAVDSAGSIESTAAYASVLTGVAIAYNAIGLTGAAIRVADYVVSRTSQDVTFLGQVAQLARLASVYVAADRLETVREYIAGLSDPYTRSVLSVSVAERLTDEGRQGLADDFLVDALLEADRTEYLSDALRRDIAVGFARSGNYSLAIRTIERISDPLLRTRAITGLGYVAGPRGGLSDSQLASLDAILDR